MRAVQRLPRVHESALGPSTSGQGLWRCLSNASALLHEELLASWKERWSAAAASATQQRQPARSAAATEATAPDASEAAAATDGAVQTERAQAASHAAADAPAVLTPPLPAKPLPVVPIGEAAPAPSAPAAVQAPVAAPAAAAVQGAPATTALAEMAISDAAVARAMVAEPSARGTVNSQVPAAPAAAPYSHTAVSAEPSVHNSSCLYKSTVSRSLKSRLRGRVQHVASAVRADTYPQVLDTVLDNSRPLPVTQYRPPAAVIISSSTRSNTSSSNRSNGDSPAVVDPQLSAAMPTKSVDVQATDLGAGAGGGAAAAEQPFDGLQSMLQSAHKASISKPSLLRARLKADRSKQQPQQQQPSMPMDLPEQVIGLDHHHQQQLHIQQLISLQHRQTEGSWHAPGGSVAGSSTDKAHQLPGMAAATQPSTELPAARLQHASPAAQATTSTHKTTDSSSGTQSGHDTAQRSAAMPQQERSLHDTVLAIIQAPLSSSTNSSDSSTRDGSFVTSFAAQAVEVSVQPAGSHPSTDHWTGQREPLSHNKLLQQLAALNPTTQDAESQPWQHTGDSTTDDTWAGHAPSSAPTASAASRQLLVQIQGTDAPARLAQLATDHEHCLDDACLLAICTKLRNAFHKPPFPSSAVSTGSRRGVKPLPATRAPRYGAASATAVATAFDQVLNVALRPGAQLAPETACALLLLRLYLEGHHMQQPVARQLMALAQEGTEAEVLSVQLMGRLHDSLKWTLSRKHVCVVPPGAQPQAHALEDALIAALGRLSSDTLSALTRKQLVQLAAGAAEKHAAAAAAAAVDGWGGSESDSDGKLQQYEAAVVAAGRTALCALEQYSQRELLELLKAMQTVNLAQLAAAFGDALAAQLSGMRVSDVVTVSAAVYKLRLDCPKLGSSMQMWASSSSGWEEMRSGKLDQLGWLALRMDALSKGYHEAGWDNVAGAAVAALDAAAARAAVTGTSGGSHASSMGSSSSSSISSSGGSMDGAEASSQPFRSSSRSAVRMSTAPELVHKSAARLSIAFARQRHFDAELMRSLVGLLTTQRPGRIKPDALACIAWSLATFAFGDEATLRVLVAHTQAQLPNCQPSQLAILAWAAAVLGARDGSLWTSIDAAVRAPGQLGVPQEWKEAHASQLFQAHVHCANHVCGAFQLPPTLLVTAEAAWQAMVEDLTVSDMQRQVLHALAPLQAKCQLEDFKMEGRTTSNRHSVDILIRHKGTHIAMEVDGPMHFTANRPYRRLGRTVLRDRMLAGQGLKVVSVPWYEWNECKGSQAREEYLLLKLDEAVAGAARRI